MTLNDKINEELNDAKDTVNDAVDSVKEGFSNVKDSIKSKWDDITDFDINVSKFNKTMDKLGWRDNLPEEIKSRLDDGSLTDEEVRTYFNNHKEELKRKIDESPDSDEIKNIILVDEE